MNDPRYTENQSMASRLKRKGIESGHNSSNSNDSELFVDAPPDEEDLDTSDSEESVISGLEEESDSSDVESSENEDAASSGDSENTDDDELEIDKSEELLDNQRNHASATDGNTIDNVKSVDTAASSSSSDAHNNNANKEKDEYEEDSSDEEDIRNTVGNIPMQWYKEYAHIGYNLDGKRIIKPKEGDELDEFLNKMDNPNYWRTVRDDSTGQKVVLADEDVALIQRYCQGKFVDPSYDPYQPWVDFFTYETMIHPVTNHPATKASFIPSKWERLKVGRLVHAMKMGWIKPRPPKTEDDEPNFYGIWNNEDQSAISKRYREHIPAPRQNLPGHEESYNPPSEYLFTEQEKLAWDEKDPEDRRIKFVPQKYSCLRNVPAYSRFINERFERCLDLYLCPRQRKTRMNVDPQDLIPKLPKPKDLQPFPTTQAIIYRGHHGLVRSISTDPTGQWFASGSDDMTVKLWEVATGRCVRTFTMEGVVKCVAWNPAPGLSLLAVAVDCDVIILNPGLGDKLMVSNTDDFIQSLEENEDASKTDKLQIDWINIAGKQHSEGLRLKISHPKNVSKVTWHGKGDYMAVVMPGGDNMSTLIHQLSRRRSQNPFRKSKGLVQCVLFHPVRPFLFVATQRYVRVYNLLKQELMKKLLSNCKWVSSMAIHPGGDNLIIGSYDCRLSWFDLDLSTKPYHTLRHHKKAVRQVCYHRNYPLFASASDDGTVIVCHGLVYNDLLQNPQIVPVKILRGHELVKDLGVLDCQFHPTQPWIFTSGSDSTIRLYT